jgi:beta-phosphoglucomutase-like phosphatase (HAD superfamily)
VTLTGVRAVLCDADGNLFPSEEPAFVASAVVTNAFLASLGIAETFTAEQLRLATTGKNFRTTAADLAVANGVAVDRPPLTRDVLQEWVDEERRQVSAHLATVLQPDPEVLEPLQRLGRRFVLAAVSSSATPRLRTCFAATGIDALIPAERTYSAEDSLPQPTSKPHPAVYLHACAQLQVAPSEAVAVEDSGAGAQSAVSAGIPTIGNLQFVAPGEREERRAQLLSLGVAEVVTSWAEVESLLA